MFFDELNQEEDFSGSMIEIALLLNRLFRLRYDDKKRLPRSLEIRKRGLFKKEFVLPPSYEETECQLKEAQNALTQKRMQAGYPNGIFWWNRPGNHLIPFLLECLSLPEEEEMPDNSGWRRAFSFFQQDGRGNRQIFCMNMQAHYQQIHSARHVDAIEHSAYTRAERDAMADIYNSRQDQKALMHMLFANQVGIHSISTGQDYSSATEYYTSAEYLSDRFMQDEQYRQSLYTVEERHTLRVSSQSRNRTSVHGLCEFHVDESGTLDYMASMDFMELYSSDLDKAVTEEFCRNKDAMLVGALLLAENKSVKSVPLSLFDKAYHSDNYTELIRVAGIMTCLAPKLKGDDKDG